MKKLQILVLLGVTVALAAVISDYFRFRQAGLRVRLAEPDTLPPELHSQASGWKWSQSSGNRRSVEGTAKRFRQTKDDLVFELEDVELKVFHEGEKTFDRISTPAALFDTRTEKLYSEAEVTMTLGLPVHAGGDVDEKPTVIRSTGVTFESKAAACSTDRYTEYEFEGGRGHSTGAFYDSINRYFRMKSDVYLERFSTGPAGLPMKIRAGELTYHEREQRVDLRNGVSLERGFERLDAKEAFVFLEEGKIRRIDAIEGRGSDTQSHRRIRFRAQRLEARYTLAQTLEQVAGVGAVELRSLTSSSDTHADGERIQLDYVTPPEASQAELREAHLQKGARIEVRSLIEKGKNSTHIRRVSAEWIHLTMRSGGEDMEMLETVTPGRLELLPQDPSGTERILTADRITAHYAPGNRVERLRAEGSVSLESSAAARRTAPSAQAKGLRSWSEGLAVEFDPDSGEVRQLKQWTDFRFEREGRRGNSNEAWLDPVANRIEMRGEARVWDASGHVAAQRIVLDEQSGDLTAEGNVASHSQDAASPKGSSQDLGGFFAPGEPVLGTADRMISRQSDGQIQYLGRARLWQHEQRIEAEQIKIDRRAKTLEAERNVVSFLRENKGGGAAEGEAAAIIRVSSDAMRYEEAARQVVYQGGVELRRAGLTVKADRLEARFHPEQAEASQERLERILTKGEVTITERVEGRQRPRQGFGTAAEYEPATEKVILTGSPARVVDMAGSETRGAQLTYYLNDDRLLVQGSGDGRAYTLRRRIRP